MNYESVDIDKDVPRYPIHVISNPDGDAEGFCPNCRDGKVICGWGYKTDRCPECGQKITWFRW